MQVNELTVNLKYIVRKLNRKQHGEQEQELVNHCYLSLARLAAGLVKEELLAVSRVSGTASEEDGS